MKQRHNSRNRKVQVFLNPHCHYDTGRTRWNRIRRDISELIGINNIRGVEDIVSLEGIVGQVSAAYKRGARCFIAAGGDGTVHLLLNAILNAELNTKDIVLGAVGLGSSNDFHKPFRPQAMIMGTPIRVNFDDIVECDLMRVDYSDLSGAHKTRHCLVNASIGITAEANAYFNQPPRFLKLLQQISVEAAIMVAALRTIFVYRNLPCLLRVDGNEAKELMISNLGVIKNPHFSGSLCYDTPIRPDDGKMGICACYNQSIYEQVGCLTALYRHRFLGRPKTASLGATHVTVKSARSFALEMDGEVVKTRQVEFSLMSKKVRCCR